MKNSRTKVAVIGTGFSGLSTGYFLLKAGAQVSFFEKSDHCGGLIQTLKHNLGFRAETAANGFLATQMLEDLCTDIGVELQATLPSAKKRFLFYERQSRWPLSFVESLKILGSILQYFLNRQKLIPKPQESILQWALRQWGDRYGSQIANKMLTPALRGIYAGDIQVLSASLILGPVLTNRLPKGKLRGTVSPQGGMSEFMQKLQSYLLEQGASFHWDQTVDTDFLKKIKSHSDAVVMAVSATAAQQILPERLPVFEMLDVVRTTVAFDSHAKKIGGFGVLFADGQGFRSLGALSNSEIFPDPSPFVSESWILGGANDPAALHLQDQELIEVIQDERAKLLKDPSPVQGSVITRWPGGFPHYTVNLERELQGGFIEKLAGEGIFLVGNYLGVLGLSRILRRNLEIVERILR